jgi:hypothetical protein
MLGILKLPTNDAAVNSEQPGNHYLVKANSPILFAPPLGDLKAE